MAERARAFLMFRRRLPGRPSAPPSRTFEFNGPLSFDSSVKLRRSRGKGKVYATRESGRTARQQHFLGRRARLYRACGMHFLAPAIT